MNKKYFIPFWIIFIIGVIFLIVCMCFNLFYVKNTEWLQALVGWFGTCGAVFIGLVAIAQNEKFDKANKDAQEKAEQQAKEYQDKLLEINDRMISLEESKLYSLISFFQKPVLVVNSDANIEMNSNCYGAFISNDKSESNGLSTIFVFSITNRTDVPIRYFQIEKASVYYSNFATGEDIAIVSYKNGGFVPSPIVGKNDEIFYVLTMDGIKDLVDNLPEGFEICLNLNIEVESVFGYAVKQKFLIRLQDRNSKANEDNKYLLWNYCYESTSEMKGQGINV